MGLSVLIIYTVQSSSGPQETPPGWVRLILRVWSIANYWSLTKRQSAPLMIQENKMLRK